MVSIDVQGPSRLSEEDRFRIEQYTKIISLRDQVVAGTHPRIKLPPRIAGKVPNKVISPVLQRSRPGASSQAQHVGSQTRPTENSKPSASIPTGPKSNGGPDINPVLLEKSDQLLRAEMNIQRRRFEDLLEEEFEAKKQNIKHSVYPDADLDITAIYDQAQALVAAAAASTQPVVTSANPVRDVDSHSDGTFYSSRHSTPDPREPVDRSISVVSEAASVGQPIERAPTASASVVATVGGNTADPTSASASISNDSTRPPLPAINTSLGEPIEAPYRRPRKNYGDLYPNSAPVVRSHNLVPAAPRPNHVSALTRHGAAVVEKSIAQQEPLRQSISSSGAEASPKTSRRKQPRGKKRKSDRFDDVQIKAEPISPEPFKSTPARKRVKATREVPQSQNDAQYSPQYAAPVEGHVRDRRQTDSHVQYEPQTSYAPDSSMHVEASSRERGPLFVRPRHPTSNVDYEAFPPHGPRYFETIDPGFAPSHSYAQRESTTVPHGRTPGAVVMVDKYGRRYYEPEHEPVRRPAASVHPESVVYERPMHPEEVVYERPAMNDEVMYQMPARRVVYPQTEYQEPSPVFSRSATQYQAPTRRVVTQHAEPVAWEYSNSPQEYYPVQPAAPERRVYQDVAPFVRPASVRPASVRPVEATRYEAPVGAYQRVASVRPGTSAEMAPPMGPPQRHYVVPTQQSARVYSSIPGEPIQRSYSVLHAAPPSRYYDEGYEPSRTTRQSAMPEPPYRDDVYRM